MINYLRQKTIENNKSNEVVTSMKGRKMYLRYLTIRLFVSSGRRHIITSPLSNAIVWGKKKLQQRYK